MFREHKQRARQALKGHWNTAIGLSLLGIFWAAVSVLVRQYVVKAVDVSSLAPWLEKLLALPSATELLAALVVLPVGVLLIPIFYGINGWFYALIQGRVQPGSVVFLCWADKKAFLRPLKLYWHITWRTLLWELAFLTCTPLAVCCGYGGLRGWVLLLERTP